MRPWVKNGLCAGTAFSVVGVAFVAVSLFTDISRSAWLALDQVKGVIGFAFCGLAGVLTALRTRRAGSGAAAGALGGAIAGVTVPVSMYVLAYGFLEAVRQYPFEHYDYLHSGAPSVQAFLRSSQGHATVLGTSLWLAPVVVAFAAILGAAVGYLGGCVGKKWPGVGQGEGRVASRSVLATVLVVGSALLPLACAPAEAKQKKETPVGRVVIVAYTPKPGMEQQLLAAVKKHLDVLDAEHLITDKPGYVMRAADGTIVEVFEWRSAEAIRQAHTNPTVQALWTEFGAACDYTPLMNLRESHEMFAEFDAVPL